MDNAVMNIAGRIQNGVVVLENESGLPEGARVTVIYPASEPEPAPTTIRRRVKFPLHPGEPGTLPLTNRRIAEILDDEDASARH
jgi:hypothetical protein